jgi:enoyl-CoA hydratase
MKEITLTGRGPNTMSLESLRAFEAEIDAAGDEPLLVSGRGTAFSAGLDLDALGTLDGDGVRALLESIESVALKLFLHPAPTVALVNGHAIAGGCLVAQCCDVRVGVRDPKVRLGMTGVAIGLTYPPFVIDVFRARLPAAHAERVLLSAARFDTNEALALGLLDELAAPDDARAIAEKHLADRAALPRAGYVATKLALRRPYAESARAGRAHFLETVVPSWTAALTRR